VQVVKFNSSWGLSLADDHALDSHDAFDAYTPIL
jgi:hypothetical protein